MDAARPTTTARFGEGLARNRGWHLGFKILLALLLGTQGARGQPVEEYQLKAAVVYNLAKFVDWPPEAFQTPSDSITICVLGDSPIRAVLEQGIGNKRIEDHKFAVRAVSEAGRAGGCHILFFPSRRARWRSVLGDLKAGGILTVGEAEGFAADGGVVNLNVEAGKVRIQINPEAAQRQGLKISSQLLSLAQIVKK